MQSVCSICVCVYVCTYPASPRHYAWQAEPQIASQIGLNFPHLKLGRSVEQKIAYDVINADILTCTHIIANLPRRGEISRPGWVGLADGDLLIRWAICRVRAGRSVVSR